MPDKFSIVIICKNEADVIGDVLQSCINLSDDIVVYDSGSTDNTVKILKNFPVQLYHGEWFGFGKTKQHAAGLAK
ncbi:MAG TPA: glycosyltransferase, partial [Flavisolibacter sp.]|nr:glycosyltransferase [Flavisolibacter sp.]